MPTQQTAIIGVSRRITAGQEFKAGLCRAPDTGPAMIGGACVGRRERAGEELFPVHPARSTGGIVPFD